MPRFADTVDAAAARFGPRTALVAPEGWSVDYEDLGRLVHAVADGLAARGVGEGDLVALCLPPCVDHLVTYLAAARVGAVTVGVNRRLPPYQRSVLLDRLAPALVVTTDELDVGGPGEVVHLRPGEGPDHVAGGLRDAEAPPHRVAPDDPDRPVALALTSGTSGAPRAAVFADRQVDAIRRADVGDRADGGGPMLASTELAHVGMVTKLAWYLRTGATLHLLHRWRAADALDVVERERVPVLGAISAQVALLLRELEGGPPRDLSHVQGLVVGGGPSSPSLVRRARAAFGAPYSIRWSSTESGGVGTATAFDADDVEALHTVGRPRTGVELEVRDDDGTVLPRGEVGRVHLRSPTQLAGWWQDPDATAATIGPDGFVRTDDLGHLDDRGCLVLAGRVADSFVRGGYNVHPEPVEAVLADHPLVAEVAVVGVEDDVMGHVGVAVVVARDPARPPTLDALRAEAGRRLAHHELPERLVLRDALPRNATDKLDRRALRAHL